MAILFSANALFAQSKEAMKKIESARIALFTERLNLSPEQAEKFWPLYRQYNERRRDLRLELRDARQGVDMKNLTDEQSKMLMEKALEIKQRELNLEKDYSEKFQNVISTQQVLRMKNAEKDFQKMLLQRLQSQREKQMQRQKMMERREMMQERGYN
jgi:hypothetical protein